MNEIRIAKVGPDDNVPLYWLSGQALRGNGPEAEVSLGVASCVAKRPCEMCA